MTQTNWDELIDAAGVYNKEDRAALRSAIERLEAQLKEAELDALTLADELTDEQNPGFICQALKLHYARLAGKEGE